MAARDQLAWLRRQTENLAAFRQGVESLGAKEMADIDARAASESTAEAEAAMAELEAMRAGDATDQQEVWMRR
eukprot:scaffold649218_cov41-Prasinocladus_malaysianus.AAC.1